MLMNTIQMAGAVAVAIGSIGGGALTMESRYALRGEYLRHVADSRSGFILSLVESARAEPPGDYKGSLCRTLQEQIGQLCQEAPTHSICLDRSIYLQRSGCL